MKYIQVLVIIIAFAISALSAPIILPILKRLKVGQTPRTDGPKTHLTKTGTPTMGGVIIILGFLLPTIYFALIYPEIWAIILLTIGYGLIGLVDDYIKVVKKKSDGLSARQKLIMQLIVTLIFCIYVLGVLDLDMSMKIPFISHVTINIGWMSIPFMFAVSIGTANGTNFTDGIDGLATSVTIVVALFYTIASLHYSNPIALAGGAMIGALFGFLIYNIHPAKVFMGDTGSLALGGFVASMAYLLQMPLFIAVVGLIYLVEVLSVVIQVQYFKVTKGKRFFKMAPIHHHFEMCGWSEKKIVIVFTVLTAILGMIASISFIG